MSDYIKKIAPLFATLLLLLLLITACTQPAEIALDESADGTAVTLEPGQELVIRLESNVTTGYSWGVIEVDPAVLQQIGESEYEGSEPGLVGGGGWETYHFEAVESGRTTLQLAYRQPWEEDVPPAETFTIDVTVR